MRQVAAWAVPFATLHRHLAETLVAGRAYSAGAAYCQMERLTSHLTADGTAAFPLIAGDYFLTMM